MSSPERRPGAAGAAGAAGAPARRRRPVWVWLLLALLAIVLIVVISLLASRCGSGSTTGAPPAPPANGAPAGAAGAAPGAPGGPPAGAPPAGAAGAVPGAAGAPPAGGAPGTAPGQPGSTAAPGAGGAAQGQAGSTDPAALQARIDRIVAADPISFRPNSAQLSDSGSASLRQVARELGTVPTVRVAVTGHAAPIGGPGTPDPQQLSEQRATVVADELAAAGVARDRLQTRGVSDTDPGPSPAVARRADVSVS
ncbi:OmpA family protein [Actinomycetospora atypica]|uniref:OmpA family protein n=1 Tax=Actinomycetospora atypica TaxID=1290095 RepID=A0ABV9YML4_9PSEU